MALGRLDHYSIRTMRLEETRRFYTEVLGLEVGPRPPLNFPGVWLYNGADAVVHVIGIDPDNPQALIEYLGEKGMDGAPGTGTVDHIAFAASDAEGMRARFLAAGARFRERTVPGMNLRQIFLEDPNGVTIELNFPT